MLVVGMLTGGLALQHKQQVTSAAREAARYGATVPELQCVSTANCWVNDTPRLPAASVHAPSVNRTVKLLMLDGSLEASEAATLVESRPALSRTPTGTSLSLRRRTDVRSSASTRSAIASSGTSPSERAASHTSQ